VKSRVEGAGGTVVCSPYSDYGNLEHLKVREKMEPSITDPWRGWENARKNGKRQKPVSFSREGQRYQANLVGVNKAKIAVP